MKKTFNIKAHIENIKQKPLALLIFFRNVNLKFNPIFSYASQLDLFNNIVNVLIYLNNFFFDLKKFSHS